MGSVTIPEVTWEDALRQQVTLERAAGSDPSPVTEDDVVWHYVHASAQDRIRALATVLKAE